MKAGKLYSYFKATTVWKNTEDSSFTMDNISSIKENEPFLVLEVVTRFGYSSCKVLSSQGIVGWVNMAEPDRITEVAANT